MSIDIVEPGPRQGATAGARISSHRLSGILGKVIVYMLLVALGALFLFPFYWMLATSLKAPGNLYLDPPQWIPNPFYFANYPETFTQLPFGIFLRNSLTITVTATIGYVLSSTAAAYAFARLRFRGSTQLFILVLATLMLPGQVTLIPQFILFNKLGWLGTILPLVVPPFFGSAFYIFLMRQFFMTLPRELDEAATIDGANPIQIFWSVVLPLAKPAVATITVFSVIYNWNDFFGPLIYLTRLQDMTLAVGLQLFRGQYGADYAHMMAGATVAIVPIMIVFFIAQDAFVQSIALTGLKG